MFDKNFKTKPAPTLFISGDSGGTPPKIDVPESITLFAGEKRQYAFYYNAGSPPAATFNIKWYDTEEDRESDVNQLVSIYEGTEYPITDIPYIEFYPDIPHPYSPPFGLDNHEGYLLVRAPNITTPRVYYGRVVMSNEYYSNLEIQSYKTRPAPCELSTFIPAPHLSRFPS